MKIGIDLMGGDFPDKLVLAVNEYANKFDDKLFLFSTKENENIKLLEKRENIEVVYCKSAVSKEDDPAFVVRQKKDSTLVAGAQYLSENKIDSFISAGNTGALVSAGIFVVKRINGISKPALPGFLPRRDSQTPVMLLDLGANIAPTKDNLLQYAQIASKYMSDFYGINNPSLKLVNIGEEDNKGIELYKELNKELTKLEGINFQGNIEPRYVLEADCDIILMDGWTGNILLKSIEGAVKVINDNLKRVFYKKIRNKICAIILKRDIKKMVDELDYKELGGTPILGVDGLLIKAHGSSNQRAFYQAIVQAKNLKQANFLETLKSKENL